MDAFINCGCLKGVSKLINYIQSNKSSDITILMSLLSSISSVFTSMEHTQEDAVEFTEAITKLIYAKGSAISK